MASRTKTVANKKSTIGLAAVCWLLLSLCSSNSIPESSSADDRAIHPEWSYNLSIYEVNLRQYSEEGTFAAFEQHLPRLRDLGVGILWFMPIHPIGEKNRKGSLGSYYSIKDYRAVNPEHGTLDEFKALVQKIHEMGMYVLLDWVANHTAWDNPLTTEHPEWYTKDNNGSFVPPVPDWHDVIDLNYDQPGLRRYMIDAMKFWVEEVDVDGFRCDVAEMVPLDFWKQARKELDAIKPVFMLAEGEAPELHENGFDMTYSWRLFKLMNEIAQGNKNGHDLENALQVETDSYPAHAVRMYFTTNHDENSWNGTVFERLGEGVETFAVLAATLNGMPLVYSGQEAGLDKRLAFFEKDPIPWRDHKLSNIYSVLFQLKREKQPLWHGERGGTLTTVANSNQQAVYSFVRQTEDKKAFVVLNLSGADQIVSFQGEAYIGDYTEAFTNEKVSLSTGVELQLKPWDYRMYVQ